MELWERIGTLNGQTLYTTVRKKPFTVSVKNDRVEFVPLNGSGTVRWESRQRFEYIDRQEWAKYDLQVKRVCEEIPQCRNGSYIVAILSATR